VKLDEQKQKVLFAAARKSLAPYMRLQWPGWKRGRHIDRLIRKLHQVERGEVDRLIVLMPPRHSKSMTVSHYFPAWCLGKNPDWQIIASTYSQDLSNGFGRKVRDYIRDPRHRRVFPESRILPEASAKDHFVTTSEGVYVAVGRGGTVTGRGAHLFVVDDPVKDKVEATSETLRKSLHEWFQTVAYTRLQPGGRIVICQTLWNEDDLAGWLMREHMDDGWEVLSMAAIAEQDEEVDGALWREEGEALWPEFWPLHELERRRAMLSTEDWLCLYQQKCISDAGNVFKVRWFDDAIHVGINQSNPFDSRGMTKYIVVDPANSKKRTSDYTSMWVLGLGADENIWVLDMLRDRLDTPGQRADALFALHRKHKPIQAVLYEEYGLSGDVATIRERQLQPPAYWFSIRSVGGSLAKTERIKQLEPFFRAGRIRLPEQWWTTCEGKEVDLVKEFKAEYKAFPKGAHDDMLDALARIRTEGITLDFPQTAEERDMDEMYNTGRSALYGSADTGATWLSE
jgi:predicted phage terminase large subunit-like protein